jgi:hypothetical protein
MAKIHLSRVPQKFNTFNTFSTFNTFEMFIRWSGDPVGNLRPFRSS